MVLLDGDWWTMQSIDVLNLQINCGDSFVRGKHQYSSHPPPFINQAETKSDKFAGQETMLQDSA